MTDVARLLSEAQTIAVVGLSPKPDRDSNSVARYLQDAGYRIIPVNPKEEEILGEQCYPSLTDVPEPIDIVDVFRRGEHTPPIVQEAVAIGAKAVWLQQGIRSEESRRIAEEAGLDYIEDECIRTVHRFTGGR